MAPNPSAPSYASAAACLVVIAVFWYVKSRNATRNPLPPGPRGLPLIGNVLQMPKEYEWLTYRKWAGTFGDIFSLSIFGQSIVVLNSWKTANSLLDKRSALYSDRPRLVMAGELVGLEHSVPLSPYNERFREMRKLLQQALGPRQAAQYQAFEEQETVGFLRRLLDTPERFLEHIRNITGSKILQVSHGYKPQAQDDVMIKIVNKAMDDFALATVPGAFLVDFLPWLKYIPEWMPGAGFKRVAKIWLQEVNDMNDVPYDMVKQQMASGNYTPSFTSSLLEGKEVVGAEQESVYKWAVTGLYAGGAETTVSSISSFFLAMVTHPEVQKKAHAELDAVVGSDRLPTFADRPRLPYIDGIVKEVLRWNPLAPLGLPHRVTRDDIYEDYTIPAGAIVIANIWAMLHDESVYPDAMSFDPDRYTRTKGNPELNRDPHSAAFGFGRRICPGIHLADGTLWATFAFTLWAFDITKAKAADGTVIEPLVEYTSATISHPKPFQCRITPRSERVANLIRSKLP